MKDFTDSDMRVLSLLSSLAEIIRKVAVLFFCSLGVSEKVYYRLDQIFMSSGFPTINANLNDLTEA